MTDITTLLPNKEQFDTMNMMLGVIACNTEGISVNTFADVKQIFRRGLGKAYFKRGDIMPVAKETSITIGIGDSTGITGASINATTFLNAMGTSYNGIYEATFDGAVWKKEDGTNVNLATYGITITGTAVEGDHLIITETAAIINFVFRHVDNYNAILEAQNCFTSMNYDAPEALFYCENALPAGTYNITLYYGCYANSTAEDGTYQFTTTVDIPAGGVIRHSTIGAYRSTGYAQSYVVGGKFTTYATASSSTALESDIVTTIGDGGTNLGTFTSREPGKRTDTNCNFTDRNAYGSNKWSDSAIRKWLNSSNAANEWWTSTTLFDRPSNNMSAAGFMNGLDQEFLSIVVDTTHDTQLSISDGYGLESTTEKFFLASRPEIFSGVERGTDGADGIVWDFYKDFSDLASAGVGADSNRIPRNSSGATTYRWLRTPHAGYGDCVRIVCPDGRVSDINAYASTGVVPACKIGVDESDTTVANNS